MKAIIPSLLCAAAILAACSAVTDGSSGSTPYNITIQVSSGPAHVTAVQVCANFGHDTACGPDRGFVVGSTNTLAVKANPGEGYTVTIPDNQQASAFCVVSSGATGVFGTSAAVAVVTCS